MFFNLAWRNSKRNRSENLIYFLTMVTAVATFYIVLSLGSQDVMRFLEEIESDAVNRLLTMLMPTVYLFSLLFVFFLVIFAATGNIWLKLILATMVPRLFRKAVVLVSFLLLQ